MTRIQKTVLLSSANSWLLAIVFYLAVATITRLALIIANFDQIQTDLAATVLSLAVGFIFDLISSSWIIFPYVLILALLSQRWLQSRICKWLVGACWLGFVYGLLFLGVVEYFFFDEFSSRFNSVAVDYLIFPHEVLVNIWDTYPLWQILVADLCLATILLLLLRKKIRAGLDSQLPRRTRLLHAGGVLAFAFVATWLVSPRLAMVSDNRVVQQIAHNGIYSFAVAALTNELDYDAYYARTDDLAAFTRVRELIKEPSNYFLQPPESLSIDRVITYPGPARKLNIVIVLEESFGANFVRSLDSTGPAAHQNLKSYPRRGSYSPISTRPETAPCAGWKEYCSVSLRFRGNQSCEGQVAGMSIRFRPFSKQTDIKHRLFTAAIPISTT